MADNPYEPLDAENQSSGSCPACPESSRFIQILGNVVWILIAGIYVFALVQSWTGSLFARVVAASAVLVFVFLGMHLLVAIHELGHAVAGAIARLEVDAFQVGIGPLIYQRKSWDKIFIEWRLFPILGLVTAGIPDDANARARMLFFFSAGPAATYGCAKLSSLWMANAACIQTPTLLAALIVSGHTLNALAWGQLIANLIPLKFLTGGRLLQTDGMQILLLLFSPDVWIQRFQIYCEQLRQIRLPPFTARALSPRASMMPELKHLSSGARAQFAEACSALWRSEYAEARRLFEVLLHVVPLTAQPLIRSHLLFAAAPIGSLAQTRKMIRDLVAAAPMENKAQLLDFFAWIPIVTGASELLNDAVAWIGDAREFDPTYSRLEITEAALWAEMCDPRAEAALRAVLNGGAHVLADRGVAAFYLSRILLREGYPESEIQPWINKATKWCPQPWLARRVRSELQH